MRNPCTLHLESLERPVPSTDSADEARSDMIALKLHGVESIELGRSGGFTEIFVDGGLQIGIKRLKQIFEKECE